jgi:hypothetical protein
MKLRIGIVGDVTPGWKLLLDQEGVWYDAVADLSDFDFSALVISGAIAGKSLSYVETYLRQGGAVLCFGESFAAVAKKTSRNKTLQYILPEKNSPWTGAGLLDLDLDCVIPPNANYFRTNRNSPAVFSGEFGGGYVIALPFDAGTAAVDNRVRTKSFYAQRDRLPFERVSLINRSSLRRLVSRSLELLHHRRGLPYLHKWYYPDEQSTLFLFRIDTDYAAKDSIEKLHSLCEWNSVPATWFIDVKSQENILDVFRNMSNHETALHCYEHQTYPDAGSNAKNIGKAMEVLARAGIEAKGFAAPFGAWHSGIRDAIEQAGFEYSSEFSYDYDNLPSFPAMGSSVSTALQVPVHPISIGSLKRQGFSTDEMIAYFNYVVAQKEAVHDPLFFYHHPNDGNEKAVTSLFDQVIERKIAPVRMLEYARWWKKRNGAIVSIEYDGTTIAVSGTAELQDLNIHATRSDGTESFLKQTASISESEIQWKTKPAPVPLPDDIERVTKFNPWVPLIRVEDFINKK